MTSLQHDVPEFAKALYEATYIDSSERTQVTSNEAVAAAAGRSAYAALLAQSGSYSNITWDSGRTIADTQTILDKYKNGVAPSPEEYKKLQAVYGDAYISKLQQASTGWWDVDKENAKLDDLGAME